MPTYSIARPSRLVRASATTMRYCGLRIFPIRMSRIFTATVFFAPDDYEVEPTEPAWGCGTDVSWTGSALRVRGRLARAGSQPSILPDAPPHRRTHPPGRQSLPRSWSCGWHRCGHNTHKGNHNSKIAGAIAEVGGPIRAGE